VDKLVSTESQAEMPCYNWLRSLQG